MGVPIAGPGSPAPGRGLALLERGFRPFFLLAGLHATVYPLLWLGVLAGGLVPPPFGAPSRWHAHEMFYGFAAAAMAGFLLTAVPVWTSSAPVAGPRLAALAGLWLLGRLAVASAGVLPGALVALLDLAFLPALALAIGIPIARARHRRSYLFPAVLCALALANAAVHLDALGITPGAAAPALRAAVFLAALLVVVLGGRLTPSFTANALARAGRPWPVRASPWAERAVQPAVLAAAAADLAAPGSAASGALALAAGAVALARMRDWQTRRVLGDALVWSLHLGHAWVGVGFLCLGVADLTGWLPGTSGLHALTAGALGGMILAVMSRVPLGHTGRPLRAPRPVALGYALVSLGALLRVLGPSLAPGLTLLALSGALWSAGFALFSAVYAPILLRPRLDGQPG
jgi:uncharacterized protein involved in response to NO